MGYFDKEKEYITKNRILVGIIAALIIVNLLAFKSILSIASNKTIVIQVPQFMESGKYIIGNTFANNNVYKMWTRIWIQDISNVSYKNVADKIKGLFPFLDPQTAFKNKAELLKFVKSVQNNFITQTFNIKDIYIKNLSKQGYKKIYVVGNIYRKIGKKEDKLNGMEYIYELTEFVRNGQIYINSIKSYLANVNDPYVKKQLNSIDSVNYTDLIKKEEFHSSVNISKLKKEKMKQEEKIKKEKKKMKQEEQKRLKKEMEE